MTPRQTRPIVPALVWSLAVLGSVVTGAADEATDEARNALRKHAIGTDTYNLVAFLARQCPTPAQSKSISRYIGQLGHDDYQTRTTASHELLRLGPAAAPALRQAFDSTDVEIALHARRLWREIESLENSADKYQLVTYALRLLAAGRHPSAVPTVLSLMETTDSQPMLDQATVIVWKSAERKHADQLKAALESGTLALRIAAIPALEVAIGEQAVGHVRPLLQSPDAQVRLAAARALLDRSPAESFTTLVALLEEPDRNVQMQAAWLLNELSPSAVPVEHKLTAFEKSVVRWKSLAEALDLNALNLPLGDRRLIPGAYPLAFEEQFAKAVDEINDSYGDFQFEQTAPVGASVADGKLRLKGKVAAVEADQRLVISAKKVVGAEVFPNKFQVSTRLTGSEGGEGGWHMGLSIGRLKFLFHPGYSGGGFRVEDVNSHQYLVTNQSMTFTPVTGTMHHMTVAVSSGRKPGTTAFDVEITSGVDGKTSYTHHYECTSEQSGQLNRVGLERSGRAGGEAMFDSLTIELSGKSSAGR